MMATTFTCGLLLGILFFGGLWLTVKKSLGTPYAALWFLASSLIRTAIVLTGLYFVAAGSLQRILVSVAGFVISRFLVLWFTKHLEKKQLTPTKAN
ncbi:F1F0 ATPase subunit 2 [Pedobacter sp. UYEF25]